MAGTLFHAADFRMSARGPKPDIFSVANPLTFCLNFPFALRCARWHGISGGPIANEINNPIHLQNEHPRRNAGCSRRVMRHRVTLAASILASLLIPAVLVWLAGSGSPVASAMYARTWDFVTAMRSVDGLPWWSPVFLSGASLATDWSALFPGAFMILFSLAMGPLAGPTAAMLAGIAFGAAGSFWFLRRYTSDRRCAALGAALFVLCPSVLTHAAPFGHFSVVWSMALFPWALLGLHVFLHSPSPLSAMYSAASLAALVLTGGPAGLSALPLVVLFGVTQFFGRPIEQRPTIGLIGLASLIFLALAVVPNLPALREAQFTAGFEFAPFAEWQKVFSTKSALGWIDRQGIITEGVGAGYAPTTANGGTYPGIVAFALVVLALYKRTLHGSLPGRQARTLLSLALFAFWLSFGPRSIMGGHLAFLGHAAGAPDFAPALAWFFLAAQVWVIFCLIPPEWPGRNVVAAGTAAVYLFVPGFRLIEWIPIYGQIRAPFEFYQAGGAVCLVFASAVLLSLLLSGIRSRRLRAVAAAGALALALLDVFPYARPLVVPALDSTTYARFLEAQDFLKSSPVSGRVYPFSGREVTMLTPMLSGRPLVASAFASERQLRGAAILQGVGFASDDQLRSYARISGVSHLLVDRKDPDTPKELVSRLRGIFPVVFENACFLVLENKESLGFGFLARSYFQSAGTGPEAAAAALAAARFNAATVEVPPLTGKHPDLRGKVVEDAPVPFDGSFLKPGADFRRLASLPGQTSQRITLAAPGAPGWVVLNQAWHPDWRAFHGLQPAEIRRAFVAFPAVRTLGNEPVTFLFVQPWWYSACAMLTISGWIACLLLGLLAPLIPDSYRRQAQAAVVAGGLRIDRPKICRPIVVIPTYNEAQGIQAILDKTLAQIQPLDVLVVDDGSPDGTAGIVRSLPAFGTRIHLLERRGKLGLGSAYKAGFAWAKAQGYDAVLEMDADLSHDPADIPRLLAALDAGADAAIGSRYIGGVRVINWPEHRLMLSAFASKFVRLVTGLPLTDATSGFKALRIEALDSVPESALKAQGYGFQVELHHSLWKSGAALVEVPIVFTERRDGQTKMSAGIAVEAFLRVLQLARR